MTTERLSKMSKEELILVCHSLRNALKYKDGTIAAQTRIIIKLNRELDELKGEA